MPLVINAILASSQKFLNVLKGKSFYLSNELPLVRSAMGIDGPLTSAWVEQTWTLSEKRISNKHCSLQWEVYWQTEACRSKQKLMTTMERLCVVAWQCPSGCCWPCHKNSPESRPDLVSISSQMLGPLKETWRGHLTPVANKRLARGVMAY